MRSAKPAAERAAAPASLEAEADVGAGDEDGAAGLAAGRQPVNVLLFVGLGRKCRTAEQCGRASAEQRRADAGAREMSVNPCRDFRAKFGRAYR